MRMRKKKNGEKRLSACESLLYKHTGEPLSDASEPFGMTGARVYLEIGAGKGAFAIGMSKKEPEVCYYAMERVTDCVMLAAERAKADAEVKNLRFIIDTADNLTRIFSAGSIDAIFLNFSDPWSKKGYAKRRLTHRRYLAVYFNLLKDGGRLCFKTDNTGLFDFSLEEISAMGLELSKLTRDLHSSQYNEGNIMTEYETAFSEKGVSINMLEVQKPVGFCPEIPEELSAAGNCYRSKDRADF